MRLTQPAALILTSLSLFGCRDDRASADDDDTGTGSDPTLDPETSGGQESSTGDDPTNDTLDPDTSSSGGDDGPVCETQLCGQPADVAGGPQQHDVDVVLLTGGHTGQVTPSGSPGGSRRRHLLTDLNERRARMQP